MFFFSKTTIFQVTFKPKILSVFHSATSRDIEVWAHNVTSETLEPEPRSFANRMYTTTKPYNYLNNNFARYTSRGFTVIHLENAIL